MIVKPLRDHLYNEALWVAAVQRTVAEAVREHGGAPEARIGLVGQDKDASSYYLREFPQWPLLDVRHTDTLSATELRRYLFDDGGEGAMRMLQAHVPDAVL